MFDREAADAVGSMTVAERGVPCGAAPSPRCPLAHLFEMHYAEIRRIARTALRSERLDHTLQATALIHEAWLRLKRSDCLDLDDPVALRGLLATVIRHVLVDHGRSRAALRHGGDWHRVSLEGLASGDDSGAVDLLDLDDAIASLGSLHPRRARIVELRLFGGLTHPEIARCLSVSLGTVELDWKIASHWLRARLSPR